MAKYRCLKCGVEADSKCINKRSLFFTGDREFAAVDACITIEHNVDTSELSITMPFTVAIGHDPAETKLHAVELLLGVLNDLGHDRLAKLVCEHEFVLESKSCELGCCHAK